MNMLYKTMITGMLLFTGMHSCVFGQQGAFSKQLRFDTILYPPVPYIPHRSQFEIDFTVSRDRLFVVGCNKNTAYQFHVSTYGLADHQQERSFVLANAFPELAAYSMTSVHSVDVKDSLIAILSSYSWQINKAGARDTVLISCKKYSINDFANQFDEIHLVNDSVIVLARAYKPFVGSREEAVCVLYYDFIRHKELKRIVMKTELPELCYLKPNHRIAFHHENTLVCDFDKYQVFEADYSPAKTRTLINEPVKNKVHIDRRQLEEARVRSKSERNVGPLIKLLCPYYLDSGLFVLNDVHVLNDSSLLLRVLKPEDAGPYKPNNSMELWVKDLSGNYQHRSSFEDLDIPNRDSSFTHDNYYQSTASGNYRIAGNRIIFLRWGADVYPIGHSKKEYYRLEQDFLSKHSPLPFFVIYEISPTLYRP